MSPLPAAPYQFQPATVKHKASPTNEDLGLLFKKFTKTILEAINHSMPNTSPEAQEARNEYARQILCLFCGGLHPIRKCATVDQYIKAGKCRRNHEGRIILSSGVWILRDMPGTNFKEHIDEWHRRNPGQLAAASLIHTIDARILYNDEKPQDVYQLSSKDRIATLEAELFSLRARNPQASNVWTRAQRAREGNHEDSDEEDVAAIRRGNKPQMNEEQASPLQPAHRQPTIPPVATPTSQPTQQAEHPYRRVQDATYQPPATRNFGAPVQQPTKKPETVPKVFPPIYDPFVSANIYKCSMDAPITVTQCKLLSLAPEVRSQVRKAITTRV